MADKPESKKFTHDQVGYEVPSTHRGQRCGNCEHFIPATATTPAGCEGVKRPIQIEAWCHRFEKENQMDDKKKHAGHGYKHTHIEHHHDGSHTVHHEHEAGQHKKYAVGNLDQVHDGLQDHMGAPNLGEAAANAGDHGVPAEQAQAAGLPPAPVAGA